MFPVGMVVAGGWRCAVNINAASPRLSGSIGVMVGGKWIYGSVRSFILLPKATASSPCRWVLIRSLWTPRSDARPVLFSRMSSLVLNERHGQFNLRSLCNWLSALMDKWRPSGPYRKRCTSSVSRSFCSNSESLRNAAVRQAAFGLLPHLDWLKWAHLFHLVSVEMLLLCQPELWCFKHHH